MVALKVELNRAWCYTPAKPSLQHYSCEGMFPAASVRALNMQIHIYFSFEAFDQDNHEVLINWRYQLLIGRGGFLNARHMKEAQNPTKTSLLFHCLESLFVAGCSRFLSLFSLFPCFAHFLLVCREGDGCEVFWMATAPSSGDGRQYTCVDDIDFSCM